MSNSWPLHLSSPPTIKEQAFQIADWLYNQFAKQRGGEVKIMANMQHLWEEVYEAKDNKPRVLVVYGGEQARGGFSQSNTLHRVDRQWTVVILRGHGWRNLLNNPDAVSELQEENFYDSVETLRDKIRVLTSISEEFPIDYKSCRPMVGLPGVGNSGNVFADGYTIEFSTASDIPGISIS